MYSILFSVYIMIPNPDTLDNETLPEGWIAIHKKIQWLELRLPHYPFIRKSMMGMQLNLGQLMPNGCSYLLYLTLICRELKVELEITQFNDAYMLKQNPTNPRKVYILAKQDRGINIILPKNEKNWKQYFSTFWSMGDN